MGHHLPDDAKIDCRTEDLVMTTHEQRSYPHARRISPRPVRRVTITGISFVVTLFISAGMASVPGGSDPTAHVRAFYEGHPAIILAAQVLGLAAAWLFTLFARAIDPPRPDAASVVRKSGYCVAAAAAVTAVPVVWLCLTAANLSAHQLHALALASDWSDVVLFATIAVFGASIAARPQTRWVRAVATGVAFVAAGRAVLLALGMSALEVTAPLAFIALVLSLVADTRSHRR